MTNRERNKIAFIAIGVSALLIVISGAVLSSASSKPPKPAAVLAPAPTKSPSPRASRSPVPKLNNAATTAENACYKRPPASGDIYVRMITPGEQPTAQELGGEWDWNHVLNKCETSVQMMISAAPTTAGNCTQVGYVSRNPGYNPNATPAAPLSRVVAQTGSSRLPTRT